MWECGSACLVSTWRVRRANRQLRTWKAKKEDPLSGYSWKYLSITGVSDSGKHQSHCLALIKTVCTNTAPIFCVCLCVCWDLLDLLEANPWIAERHEKKCENPDRWVQTKWHRFAFKVVNCKKETLNLLSRHLLKSPPPPHHQISIKYLYSFTGH